VATVMKLATLDEDEIDIAEAAAVIWEANRDEIEWPEAMRRAREAFNRARIRLNVEALRQQVAETQARSRERQERGGRF